MNIPNLPDAGTPIIENIKVGLMHPLWYNFFAQLLKEMQTNVSNEGYIMPLQDSGSITKLETAGSTGRILYDTDSGLMKLNNGSGFKEILTA